MGVVVPLLLGAALLGRLASTVRWGGGRATVGGLGVLLLGLVVGGRYHPGCTVEGSAALAGSAAGGGADGEHAEGEDDDDDSEEDPATPIEKNELVS